MDENPEFPVSSKLSVNLADYKKAIQAEFEIGKHGTSDEIAEVCKERIFLLLPEACEVTTSIMRTGTKDDNVRLAACKMIFEYTLGKPSPKTDKESDVDKIIRELMAPTPSE